MGLLVGGEVMSHQLLGQTLSQLYVQIYLNLWSKVPEFSSFLPQGKQEDFKTTVLEGLETAKHQVRVALDACHLARAAKSGIDACDGPPNKAENESHSSPTQCKGEISKRVLDQAGLTGGEHLIPGSNQA